MFNHSLFMDKPGTQENRVFLSWLSQEITAFKKSIEKFHKQNTPTFFNRTEFSNTQKFTYYAGIMVGILYFLNLYHHISETGILKDKAPAVPTMEIDDYEVSAFPFKRLFYFLFEFGAIIFFFNRLRNDLLTARQIYFTQPINDSLLSKVKHIKTAYPAFFPNDFIEKNIDIGATTLPNVLQLLTKQLNIIEKYNSQYAQYFLQNATAHPSEIISDLPQPAQSYFQEMYSLWQSQRSGQRQMSVFPQLKNK